MPRVFPVGSPTSGTLDIRLGGGRKGNKEKEAEDKNHGTSADEEKSSSWSSRRRLEFRVSRASIPRVARERHLLPEGRGPRWAAPGSRRESPSSGQAHRPVPLFSRWKTASAARVVSVVSFFSERNFKSSLVSFHLSSPSCVSYSCDWDTEFILRPHWTNPHVSPLSFPFVRTPPTPRTTEESESEERWTRGTVCHILWSFYLTPTTEKLWSTRTNKLPEFHRGKGHFKIFRFLSGEKVLDYFEWTFLGGNNHVLSFLTFEWRAIVCLFWFGGV